MHYWMTSSTELLLQPTWKRWSLPMDLPAPIPPSTGHIATMNKLSQRRTSIVADLVPADSSVHTEALRFCLLFQREIEDGELRSLRGT